MLQIEQMSLTRHDKQRDFRVTLPSLSLAPGEIGALTGFSGCGKSTLLEMIGLILKPDTLGHYRLNDQTDITASITGDDTAALAGLRARHFGFMLQSGGLLPYLTVQQNLRLPRQIAGLPAGSKLVESAVDYLKLRPLLNHFPKQLSIGERQRVAFIRAIAHQPAVLLADEPTAALDPVNAQSLYKLITGVVKALNITALIVSHDWSLVEKFGFTHYHAHMEENGSVFRKQSR